MGGKGEAGILDEVHNLKDSYREVSMQTAMDWMEFLSRKIPAEYRHCVRIAILAEKLADCLELCEEDKNKLVIGCFLHDVGKGLLPVELWDQSTPFVSEQLETVKLHPAVGADLIRASSGLSPDILDIIRFHHERWNGTGYPFGLAGEDIPYFARICAVLDVFDASVAEHPYEKMNSLDRAKEELVRCSSARLDSKIVQAFLRLPNSLLDIYMDMIR